MILHLFLFALLFLPVHLQKTSIISEILQKPTNYIPKSKLENLKICDRSIPEKKSEIDFALSFCINLKELDSYLCDVKKICHNMTQFQYLFNDNLTCSQINDFFNQTSSKEIKAFLPYFNQEKICDFFKLDPILPYLVYGKSILEKLENPIKETTKKETVQKTQKKISQDEDQQLKDKKDQINLNPSLIKNAEPNEFHHSNSSTTSTSEMNLNNFEKSEKTLNEPIIKDEINKQNDKSQPTLKQENIEEFEIKSNPESPGITQNLESTNDNTDDMNIDTEQIDENIPISNNEDNNPSKIDNNLESNSNAVYYEDSNDSHFFTYFFSMIIFIIGAYLIFHNKQKIMALALEGRSKRINRRRPSTASYRKLESNLEEAITSNCSQSVANVIY